MRNNVSTSVERIIAKIDNDFNPDNSDWIPRVGAWCIDAMGQIGAIKTKPKKVNVRVVDRIAHIPYPVEGGDIKVYDINGCVIKELDDASCCDGFPSTGESTSETSGSDGIRVTSTMSVANMTKHNQPTEVFAETVNDKYPNRYNYYNYGIKGVDKKRNFVLIDNNKIELNFDAEYICIVIDTIETYYSKVFKCDLPKIPNNAVLIEAITYYCMYKMLCRGFKHPVLNLQASQYGTNPYYIYNQLKDEAERSILNDGINQDVSKLFRSSLFIQTYYPRG